MNKALKAVAAMALMMFLVAGCNKPDEPYQGDDDELDGHEYVDLGLPSGTLWATCNVGADTPEDTGDYFAWGEIAPKDSYDWESYKYGDEVDQRFEMTKYCTDSCWGLNGFVDSLIVLEPIDDAATANWGAEWRMPTIEEWEELFLNTTGTWTVQNDVKGWLFMGTNGNTLFLPAAGYWWGTYFNDDMGLYWSSSVNKEFPYRAWGFHFNTDSAHLCGSSDRNRGQVVRAVCAVN